MSTSSTKNLLTVVVADNSAALRLRLVEMLSQIAGLEVIAQAQDVPEAMATIPATKPEVVILDLEMPGGSGIDVLREIKADFPDTIVVILTNYAESQYKEKCEALKANYFLSKSGDSKQLLKICKHLVEAKAQRFN